jgi:ubiquinone/menaquinone biosynthesis C-methylase UbiE
MDKIFKPSNKSKLESIERYRLIPPKRVLDLMDLKNGQTMLDIGAGTGYFAIPALSIIGAEGKLVVADISPEMLADIKSKIPENQTNIEYLLCETNHLGLTHKSFDQILMAFVFHEIEHQKAYLQMLKPLLTENGQLTLVEWAKADSPMGPPKHERIEFNEVLNLAETVGFKLGQYAEINDYQYACTFK